MTGQLHLREMLRTQVAPAFRELGMRGSGQKYWLPNENGDHALVEFRKDRWNAAYSGACRFTLEYLFYSGAAWEKARSRWTWLPAKPNAGTYLVDAPDGPAEIDVRWENIARLMPVRHGYDGHCWTIRTADDVPAVADHVIALLRDGVLPGLRAQVEGDEPPAPPGTYDGLDLDCPWPYCTNSDDLVADESIPGGGVEAPAPAWASPSLDTSEALDTSEQAMLSRARQVVVPRTRAWKLLHISRKRLDLYADRLGAGPQIAFHELLTIALLGIDDLHTASQWGAAATTLAAWLRDTTELDPNAVLLVAGGTVTVSAPGAALSPEGPTPGVEGIYTLTGAVREILLELDRAALI